MSVKFQNIIGEGEYALKRLWLHKTRSRSFQPFYSFIFVPVIFFFHSSFLFQCICNFVIVLKHSERGREKNPNM